MAQTASQTRAFDSSVVSFALIAATALLASSALVTANGKDFRRVPGLVLIEA